MKNLELNFVIKNLQEGKITKKQAVDKIILFINNNYPIFGLHKYDEDFRSELILSILEKGEHILSLYNPQAGDFFTFLYCYILMQINSKRKILAKNSLSEYFAKEEYRTNAELKQLQYSKLNYSHIDMPKAPYAFKTVPAEELQKALSEISRNKTDKKLLVLALKASYYITEPQIEKICRIYHINKSAFYEILKICKDSIENRIEKREKFIQRRNYAYYHHKRYKKLMENLSFEDDSFENDVHKTLYLKKEIKYHKQWNNLNKSFEKGFLNLRPTNKTVADILGICERQVSYYINCAKKEAWKVAEDFHKKNADENKSE